MSYILGAKPKDHTYLFDWIENSHRQNVIKLKMMMEPFINTVILIKSH
ncbi:hypothetical protein BGP_3743 [Beggiatoa sp. PS]|nr:hypothetical protein BGP_3743 [Beggiatoa sp. PS]